jgi:hypothetical protein
MRVFKPCSIRHSIGTRPPFRQKFSFIDRHRDPDQRAICGRNGDMVSGGRAGGRAACTRIASVHH